jgi:hypothetical protein
MGGGGNGDGGVRRRKVGEGAVILASEVGGPSHGRTGEAEACLSSGERERSGTAARAFERVRRGRGKERIGGGWLGAAWG